jgi:hypothetical protein
VIHGLALLGVEFEQQLCEGCVIAVSRLGRMEKVGC